MKLKAQLEEIRKQSQREAKVKTNYNLTVIVNY